MEALAKEKMDNGKFSEAVSVLTEIIKNEAPSATIYNMRGVAYYNLNKNANALTDFDNAISLDTSDYRFFYNRGNVKRTLNRPESAVEDYNKAIQLETEEYELFLNRALSLMAANNLKASIEDFNRAEVLSKGKDDKVFFYRGKALMITEEFNKALDNFTKCIEVNPNNGEAFFGKALAKINLANGTADDETCIDIDRSIALGYIPARSLKGSYCKKSEKE
ncbi:MAG: tetratricopeptide repeat protein [Bacteroidota bacterium]